MNNVNNRSFTERGRELLDQLKQFIIDVNSNNANKQVQLTKIIEELEEVQKKVSNIHIKFLRKYNSIKGTPSTDGPVEYPQIMQMDAYLAKLQANKNKEEKNKKNEENRLAEEQRKLNQAKTENINKKSKTIRETIERLRINIGNTNNSSNNNYKPPNIFNNVRPNNVRPNNVRPNNVRPNNLVSHPLKPNMRAFQNQLRSKLANRRTALGYNSPPPSNNRKLINIPNNRTKFINAKKALVARLAGGNKSV